MIPKNLTDDNGPCSAGGKLLITWLRTAGMRRRRGATAAAEAIRSSRTSPRHTRARQVIHRFSPAPCRWSRRAEAAGTRPTGRRPGPRSLSPMERAFQRCCLGSRHGPGQVLAVGAVARRRAQAAKESVKDWLQRFLTLPDALRLVPGDSHRRAARIVLGCGATLFEEAGRPRRSGRARACLRRAWEWCGDRGSWGWRC